jgi:hypothetical protein
MTYEELLNRAIEVLNLDITNIDDYRPACNITVKQINGFIPNAIVIWLKTGETLVYIDKQEEEV